MYGYKIKLKKLPNNNKKKRSKYIYKVNIYYIYYIIFYT